MTTNKRADKAKNDMKQELKVFNTENVWIWIKSFELTDVSFYGCDVRFYVEIQDKETGILLKVESVEFKNLFPSVDEDEEIDCFLEGKGIDFYEEYDGDFDNIPKDLQEEYEDYLLQSYNEYYQEMFYFGERSLYKYREIIIRKFPIDKQLYLIRGDNVAWITVGVEYGSTKLHSVDVKIHTVYNINTESWIYDIEGNYFVVYFSCDHSLHLTFYERDENYKFIVKDDDFIPDYYGKAGNVLYSYSIKRPKP